jgi:LysW-gamma-L-lysine carboxypeptidase
MMTNSPQNAPLVDADGAERLLVGLVERYSPSGQEQPAVAFLVEQMRALGYRAEIDGVGNAVGSLGHGQHTILLLGHIDTVPGQIEVQCRDGLLYGRGSVDAKGPLAAFVVAAARVGARIGARIVVVGAVEEESATSKGARYLLDRVSPEVVVIGEPSAWDRVTVAYKGRLLVDYALSRETAHTAGPGTSVCEEAVAFWQRVSDDAAAYNTGRSRMFDQLSPSLRSINSQGDGFSETVRLTIGFRLPDQIDIDDLQSGLIDLARGASLRFRGRERAYRASKNTSLARAFIRAIRAAGGQPRFTVKSGTSDMNVVGPIWKCPILAYGPGDSCLDHTPHEHVDLDEYHRAIAVLEDVLADLTQSSEMGENGQG